MRIVIVGGGSIAAGTVQILTRRSHQVVLVDIDKERLDAIAEEVDCGLLHGDGTRPAVLREADPKQSDVLLCLTGNDQTNIIASLVGRSLGYPRVIPRIDAPEFEHICIELGLEDTVVPAPTIARFLADMVEGHNILEVSSAIRAEARVFVFVARPQDEGSIAELGLPEEARVTHLYREGRLVLADPETRLRAEDEVVVITHHKALDALRERWAAPAKGA